MFFRKKILQSSHEPILHSFLPASKLNIFSYFLNYNLNFPTSD